MQEAHNSESEEVLAADEQPTPMWLPLLGAALLLLAIIAFVATRSSSPAEPGSDHPASDQPAADQPGAAKPPAP